MKPVTKYLVLLFIFSVSISLHAWSQEDVKIKKKEFQKDEVLIKEAWKAVRAGNEYYQLGIGMAKYARENFLKANNYNSENAQLNYKLGVCYLFSDDKYQAIDFFKKAYGLDDEVAKDIHFMLGQAYHITVDFDKAIAEYSNYVMSLDPEKDLEIILEVKKRVAECRSGLELLKNPSRVIFTNLGEKVNSPEDDYNSIFLKNDSILYFNSRRPYIEDEARNAFDDKYNEDIYTTYKMSGKWQNSQRVENKINKKTNRTNAAVVAFSADGNSMYMYRKGSLGKNYNMGDFYVSTYQKGKWLIPLTLEGPINTKYRETSLCLTPDGNTMYFCSADKKTSLGGLDIFVTKKDSKGRWEKPLNIGATVNTPYNEEGVFFDADSNYLYFSSRGHNTMGGYDVFKTQPLGNGQWSTPVNLGYPINSPDNDIFYKKSWDGKYGYISAIRDHGIGGYDIYKITRLGAEKELVTTQQDVLIAGLLNKKPHIFFKNPEFIELDNSIYLQGLILDAKTKAPIISKLDLIDLERSAVIASTMSVADGNYKIKIGEKKTYGIEIVAKDYMLYLDIADLGKETATDVIVRNFEMQKIEVGDKVVLKNIFFDTGKAILKPESYPELENVQTLLENNPTLRIEISGHTDNVGADAYNQKLSENRARAVVNYLTGKGVSTSRIEYKGYGEAQPIADNGTSTGKAQNRRVEFKVLSK